MIDLHHGDCLDILATLPDASVDAVCTDPPYGLSNTDPAHVAETITRWVNGERDYLPGGAGFMGKAWDAFVPPVAVWDECLRVLKPGGHLLAFAGDRTMDLMTLGIRLAGFTIRPSLAWLHGQGFPKHKGALKPAFEPVIVARKPFRGSVEANVLLHGTGALSINECRTTPGEGKDRAGEASRAKVYEGIGGNQKFTMKPGVRGGSAAGRWPANVVLDESQAAALDEQSGELTSGDNCTRTKVGSFLEHGGLGKPGDLQTTYGDTGGASRFFYVAKADASERVRVNGTAHPTVKPLALMRWLVRLVTPPGGTVLEPFAGSGTTVEACILEGFSCIAIEREADYLPLIRQRIARRRDPVEAVRAAGEDRGLFDLLDDGGAA